jgi:hypothetical protein
MAMQITVRKRGMTPKVAKRVLNDIHRAGMRQLGEKWHTEYRPLHFRNLASTRYNYTPRQGERGRTVANFNRSYTGRKLAKFGHTRPLVYTGESERASQTPTIEAVAKRGSARVAVRMRAYKLNYRYAGSPIDMRAELQTVIPAESQALADGLRDFLARNYRAVGDQSTTVIKG